MHEWVVDDMNIQIPLGKQAIYTASVTYAEGETAVLTLGDAELFAAGGGCLRLCGSRVRGEYAPGTYGVCVTINSVNQLVMVEVTLIDGGTLRRGTFALLGGDMICWSVTAEGAVTREAVCFTDAVREENEAVVRESYEGVYNLVTSFDDACTTRLFAWTAADSFVQGQDGMVLRYRAMGETAWRQVDARHPDQMAPNPGEVYFKADLTGLMADTEYEYKLCLRGAENGEGESGIYTFRTAPAEVGDFSFVAVGDTQGDSLAGEYILCQIALERALREAGDAAFMLNTGDITHAGSNLCMWNWQFAAMAEFAPSLPHFAAVGNHDTWGDVRNNYFSLHFNHPHNGAGALDRHMTDRITNHYLRVQADHAEDTVYSFDYGRAHFTVLHSGSYVPEDEYMLEAQREWLIRDLEASKGARWRIIMVHEPVYHRKGDGEARPWLHDVIEAYGVDLVLQGHSHLVSRTYPMKDGRIVTKTSPDHIRKGAGTVYTTIGATSLYHDPMGDNTVEEYMLIATPEERQATYTVVSVGANRLVMTVKQLDGLIVDRFTIQDEE